MSFEVWRPSGDRLGFKSDDVELGAISVGRIFYETLANSARTIIHQGGESSGKTVNILHALAYRAATEQNIKITIVAQTHGHLRTGSLADFLKWVYPHYAKYIRQFNKSESTFYWHNGNIMEFMSCDDELKARGPRRQYLYINEANSMKWETYTQLSGSRTASQVIIDYNPSSIFWAHTKVQNERDSAIFYSDHRHNLFLSKAQHELIESYKDDELFRVYGRGITGNVKGIIFPNWTMITPEDFDQKLNDTGAKIFGGLDFGFTSSQTAGVKMFKIGNQLYVKELCYEPDIQPEELKAIFTSAGFTKNDIVYCDPAQTSIGRDLRSIGGTVWKPAKKPQGSVNAGILMLKKVDVYYVGRHIKYETERYMWEPDGVGGLSGTPAEGFDHLMDAIRYGYYMQHWKDK